MSYYRDLVDDTRWEIKTLLSEYEEIRDTTDCEYDFISSREVCRVLDKLLSIIEGTVVIEDKEDIDE